MNSVAIYTDLHISMQYDGLKSFGKIPRKKISGCNGISHFNFLKDVNTDFYSVCSSLDCIREMQNKITLTFIFTLERVAIVKKQVIKFPGVAAGKTQPFCELQ